MKINRRSIAWFVLLMFLLASCGRNVPKETVDSASLNQRENTAGISQAPQEKEQGKIYLYGEQHNVEKILAEELRVWSVYYHENNMRHLFVELPYFTGELLNAWMLAEEDDIFEEIHKDWEDTSFDSVLIFDFYKAIKENCPETIFHGTDVGHQYDTTGKRYLEYLEINNLQSTEQYVLAKEAVEQGKEFYKENDFVYREEKMVENFIREFNRLTNEDIMGIYGAAHTNFDAMEDATQSVPCMANQLKKMSQDKIFSEDLSWLAMDIEPIRIDVITLNGQEYEGAYFGQQDISWLEGYEIREFWCLEGAYEAYKGKPLTGDVLPDYNYPMVIEKGQVYVIDYTTLDGIVERTYHRCDGNKWQGTLVTEEFLLD